MWSFIPGAAEMYMGFMKQGVSLMSLFVASIIIPVTLRITDVFMLGAFYCSSSVDNLTFIKHRFRQCGLT